MQDQEPEGRRRRVLGDEDQQQNQDHEAGALWSSLIAGFVILILLLIFITQNTAPTAFRFLGLHWSLPLGVAILLAGRVRGVAAHAAIFAPSSAE
ncbi:hypothetical protein MAHJHV63_55290 [Mycobacterium avium subsp. hominissuis]